MSKQSKSQTWRWLQAVAVLAAVLYCSWPLGPWLNPAIGTRGMGSELEAIGQPYNWLFIGGDISSSIILIGLCYWIWRHIRSEQQQRLLAGVLTGAVLFGVGTIADALLPINCAESVQHCPSYHQDHLLLVHGLFSIGASFCLFVGLALLWWQRRQSVILNGIMVGYILFGLFSFIAAITPGRGTWSQHYYITLCSVYIALLPYMVRTELQKGFSSAAAAPPNQAELNTNRAQNSHD